MRIKSLVLAASAALLVAGCASMNEAVNPDSGLAQRVAGQYGVSPSEVLISNRTTNAMGSYFDVSIPSRGINTRCHIYASALSLGIFATEPTCGDQMGSNPLTNRR